MRRNRLTVDELLEELRGQGYTDLAGVKYAILETNGQLSVLPYAKQKPPTARQLGLESRETGLPLVLISDGRICCRHNLKPAGAGPGLAGQAAWRSTGIRNFRVPLVPADASGPRPGASISSPGRESSGMGGSP